MKVYKTTLRSMVDYHWMGPDIFVVVIQIGKLKIIDLNYEIRPDRLIGYIPEYYIGFDPATVNGDLSAITKGRWDSNGNLMVIAFDPDTEFLDNVKNFSKLWDTVIPKLPKGNMRIPQIMGTEGGIPKGKITMANGSRFIFHSWDYDYHMVPHFDMWNHPEQHDLKSLWERVLNFISQPRKPITGICSVIREMFVRSMLTNSESKELMRDMESIRDRRKYNMYEYKEMNPYEDRGYFWPKGNKEIRIKFIKTRIDELDRNK